MAKLTKQIEVMLPDTRGVVISRFGKGNTKIGPNVVTYSKVAVVACPGATDACKEFCYAKRIGGPVFEVYQQNTAAGAEVPGLPEGTAVVRIHVSGDFDSAAYAQRWGEIAKANPSCTFWAYTHSWRDASILPALEELRALPNVQLFASVDESSQLPPDGWRIAWIEGDARIEQRKINLVCPEERGKKPNCEECGYCFTGKKGDVTFLRH
jgi:hypothetical protein